MVGVGRVVGWPLYFFIFQPSVGLFQFSVGAGRVVGIGLFEILSLNFHIFTCIFNKIRLQLGISMTFDLKKR